MVNSTTNCIKGAPLLCSVPKKKLQITMVTLNPDIRPLNTRHYTGYSRLDGGTYCLERRVQCLILNAFK